MEGQPASTAATSRMSGRARERFLARPLIARLGTSRRDHPRVLPMWFLWDRKHVWMETGADFPNARVLRENPNAALAIDESLGGLDLRAVIMRGTVELIDSPDDFIRSMLERIYAKYVGADGLGTPAVQAMLKGRHVLLRFTPTFEITWDPRSDTPGSGA